MMDTMPETSARLPAAGIRVAAAQHDLEKQAAPHPAASIRPSVPSAPCSPLAREPARAQTHRQTEPHAVTGSCPREDGQRESRLRRRFPCGEAVRKAEGSNSYTKPDRSRRAGRTD